jgi:hypothetical protein
MRTHGGCPQAALRRGVFVHGGLAASMGEDIPAKCSKAFAVTALESRFTSSLHTA